MRRFLLVVGLLLAACGGDDGDVAAPSSTASTTTSSTASTTTSSTTAGSTTSSSVADPGIDLEDGEHPAFFEGIDLDARTITVDVVQWLTGEEANEAYERETGDPGGVPNDYYILNENPRLRTLPVREPVSVRLLPDPGTAEAADAALADLASYGDNSGVVLWLTLEGGVVTEIEEQYRP